MSATGRENGPYFLRFTERVTDAGTQEAIVLWKGNGEAPDREETCTVTRRPWDGKFVCLIGKQEFILKIRKVPK